MPTFVVKLTAQAAVSTNIEVAASSLGEAEIIAVKEAKSGMVTWNYDGVDDDTIETVEQ